jgi:hypothetical protein
MLKEISGKEFKETHKNIKFYKLLNDNCIHNNYQYVNGENIDNNFKSDTRFSNGFYFIPHNPMN